MLPLLFALCTLLPASLLLVGHYFNWRGVLGRPLSALEAHVWLVSFTTATPTAAILYAQRLVALPPAICAALFCASAAASIVATFVAYGIDWLVERYRSLEDKVDSAQFHAD